MFTAVSVGSLRPLSLHWYANLQAKRESLYYCSGAAPSQAIHQRSRLISLDLQPCRAADCASRAKLVKKFTKQDTDSGRHG